MGEPNQQPPGPPENPWHRWDAHIGMKLAYWAYPHKDVKEAEKLAKYPLPWTHGEPGVELPADWPTARHGADGKLLQEGWNTQHNASGKLENQFKISINPRTKEISFDFKGSDAWSNWKSDLGNAGASEFAKIEAKAQAAYDYLSQHPDYKNYHFSATGHSLGGGMAQSFALKNNIDAAVYNSLPIARDTRHGDYFKDAGGYEAALATYKASGRVVHDVRTPNDIATFTYQGVMQNHCLSQQTGQLPTVLPGSPLPDLLKATLMASKVGALPLMAVMGQDHTMGALVGGQQGLSVGPDGRYHIPQGQREFAQIPAEARQRFAAISTSPVVGATQLGQADRDQPWNRYQINRADGSHQIIQSNTRTGEVQIDHHGVDVQGQPRHLRIELNERRGQPATFTELNAQGLPVKTETVAMSAPQPPQAPSRERQTSSPGQTHHAQRFQEQLGQRLQQLGLSEQQIQTLTAAAAKEATRHAGQGEVSEFLLSKDARHIALRQEYPPIREFNLPQALGQSAQAHWHEASQMADQPRARREGTTELGTAYKM